MLESMVYKYGGNQIRRDKEVDGESEQRVERNTEVRCNEQVKRDVI